MRVSDEIDNLKQLKNVHIISLCNVIHTDKMLYIITEKGGRDLFDFFDEHPDGVPEEWAKQIISCVLKGVMFCHDHGICHRGHDYATRYSFLIYSNRVFVLYIHIDLKPENILLEFDNRSGICRDLKLCDFGLSTKFKPNVLLNDFCGSPGMVSTMLWW
jgi:serine/threonine protein kinase